MEFNLDDGTADTRDGTAEEDEYGLVSWFASKDNSNSGLCASDLANSGREGTLSSELGGEYVGTKGLATLPEESSDVEEGLGTEVATEVKLIGDVVENTDRAGEELGRVGTDKGTFLSDIDRPSSLIMDKAFSKSDPKRNLI
jgi:hypothetical protein